MPPRVAKKSNKKSNKCIKDNKDSANNEDNIDNLEIEELDPIKREWNQLIERRQQLLKDTEEYIYRNRLELLKAKIGNKTPSKYFNTLINITVYFRSTIINDIHNCNMLLIPNVRLHDMYSVNSGKYIKYIKNNKVINYINKCTLSKEDKNLYYSRDFGYNNKDLYYLMLLDIIKDKTTPTEFIIEYIRLLINIGYSIDNLIVMWKQLVNLIGGIIHKTGVNNYIKGIKYNIYLYDPNSDVLQDPLLKPITIEEAKRLDNIEYNEYWELLNKKNSTSNIEYNPTSRYVRAVDFFANMVTDNTDDTNSIVVNS